MSLELEASSRAFAFKWRPNCTEEVREARHVCAYGAPPLTCDCMSRDVLTLLQKVAHENWLRGRAEGAAAEHTAWLLDHENYAKRAEQEGWLRGMRQAKKIAWDHADRIHTHCEVASLIDAAITKGEGTK